MTEAKLEARIEIDFNAADAISLGKLERGMRALTIEGERLAKEELSRPGSGKLYKRRSVVHQASAPGEPPAPDRGRLRQSVTSEVSRIPGGVDGEISANAEYAAHLELGTEKIEPRPFLFPILTKYRDRLLAVFTAFARM